MSVLGTCTICGMKIQPKSVFMNQHTMLEKNREDRVNRCPFCGVHKEWFELLDETFEKVRHALTLQEKRIIENAMKLEVFNSEFYDEASKLVKDSDLAEVFRELSFIERTHAKVHMRLGGFYELPALHRPNYSNRENDTAFVREAELREKHAIHYYGQKVCQIHQPIVKSLFEALSEVEREHQVVLAKKA